MAGNLRSSSSKAIQFDVIVRSFSPQWRQETVSWNSFFREAGALSRNFGVKQNFGFGREKNWGCKNFVLGGPKKKYLQEQISTLLIELFFLILWRHGWVV